MPELSTQEPFNFSEGIDGSAVQYEIIYTANSSQETCETVNIPSSLFEGDYFNHSFEVLSSSCHSSDITVTVTATNKLGDGPSSSSVIGLYKLHARQLFLI